MRSSLNGEVMSALSKRILDFKDLIVLNFLVKTKLMGRDNLKS